jgi:hypothetical protein
MIGWVKLHRKFYEWEWYDKSETVHLFLHCLLKANHKDKLYRGILVKAGTFLTSRDLLSKELGLSVRQVRTSLNRLKKTSELSIETSSQGTVIEVVKYKQYQIETSKLTSNRPATDQQQTTNKNEKNEKTYRSFAHLSMSLTEFDKLELEYTKQQIDEVIDAIQNYANNKKYKSLYLTAKNWLQKLPKEEEDKLTTKAKRLGYA